jgi:signal transduction histidine kinase
VERGLLSGLGAFRVATFAWMAAVFIVKRDDVGRGWLGVGLVALALAVTVVLSNRLRRRWEDLLRPSFVALEVGTGFLLTAGDGLVRQADVTGQAIGTNWPLVGIMSAGVALGPWAGIGAGLLMGIGRLTAELTVGIPSDRTPREALALLSTTFFYCLVGWTIAQIVRLLRRAEHEITLARAREEVARELHDGVLQTLALVERKTSDPELARLAREQERDLRAWLAGDRDRHPDSRADLGAALRTCADQFERAHGGRVQVLVADDLPTLPALVVDALAGAVGEALTNAGKHGGAGTITIYAEPDETSSRRHAVFCSVKDDGAGFDPSAPSTGLGVTRSIIGRMTDIGGRAEIKSRPGEGTEVLLWSVTSRSSGAGPEPCGL